MDARRRLWERIGADEWHRVVLETEDKNALTPFLPALLLHSRQDSSSQSKSEARARLLSFEIGDGVEKALQADWEVLRKRLREQRRKGGNGSPSEGLGLAWETEESQTQRLWIFLSNLPSQTQQPSQTGLKRMELLSNKAYADEARDSLVVAAAELGDDGLGEALVRTEGGVQALVHIATNLPHLHSKLIKSLTSGWSPQEPWVVSRGRFQVLRSLLELRPSIRLGFLQSLANSQRMMSLVLEEVGELPLLEGAEFLLGVLRRKSLGKLNKEAERKLMGVLGGWMTAAVQDERQADCRVLMQLLLSLRLDGGMGLPEGTLEFLTAPLEDWSGLGTIQLGTLLALPSLAAGGGEGRWLARMEKLRDAGSSGAGELLLLAVLMFRTNQLEKLPGLLSSVIGRRLPPGTGAYSRLGVLVRGSLFPEALLAERVAGLAVTPELSSKDGAAFLPVHSVLSLLSSRSFTKHGISIRGWLESQIKHSATPVHPALVELVDAYTGSCILPLVNDSSQSPNPPILLSTLREAFPRPDALIGARDVTSAVLFAYYLLGFRQLRCQEARRVLESGAQLPPDYPHTLWESIPFKYLTLRLHSQPDLFQPLYPTFIRHVLSQFPYLLSIPSLPPQPSLPAQRDVKGRAEVTSQELRQALRVASSKPTLTAAMLRRLPRAPTGLIRPFAEGMKDLSAVGVPCWLRRKYAGLWKGMAGILPRVVAAETRAALVGGVPSFKALLEDPLSVFGASPKILEVAELLELVLVTLELGLEASRVDLEKEAGGIRPLPAPHIPSPLPGQTEEVGWDIRGAVAALARAQESAAVQILLELAAPPRRQVRSLVCDHIHHIFIRNPLVLKLVHFQGVSGDDLWLMGDGVPSLHVALDLVPELLAQADLKHRRLAVELTAVLARRFPIPKALAVAKLLFSALSKLLQHAPNDLALSLMAPPVPDALADIARVFPPLRSQLLSLQLHLQSSQALQPKPFLKRSAPVSRLPLKIPRLQEWNPRK